MRGLIDFSDHGITDRIHELASKKKRTQNIMEPAAEILFLFEDNIPGAALITWDHAGATSQTIQAYQSQQKTMKLLAYFYITEPSSFWTASMCLV